MVGELQQYCLIECERDVVGDAFETVIGPSLKGGQGQFFTPRNVTHLVRARMRPKNQDMVLGAFNPTWIQDGGTLEVAA